jgi:hypothetical protein
MGATLTTGASSHLPEVTGEIIHDEHVVLA